MSLRDWLRGWESSATVASKPSAFDQLLAKLDPPSPGEQRFIPADEMTDEDWQLVRFSDPKPVERPSLFSVPPDPETFPWPH